MKGDCISDNEGCNAPAFITPINHPCAGLPGLKYTAKPLQPMSSQGRGPSTYLHAGAALGWPRDQKPEDTFLTPGHIIPFAPGAPIPIQKSEETSNVDRQYGAEYTPSGGVNLVLTTTSTYVTKRAIASFDTMADAQTAAKALNNHNGI